jgi:hypothetical protein
MQKSGILISNILKVALVLPEIKVGKDNVCGV